MSVTPISLHAAAKIEPERYGGVSNWEQLHDICDPDEFMLEAMDALDPERVTEDYELWDKAISTLNEVLARSPL